MTERMSRRSILEIPARAASARSCHSAAFNTGASCSASAKIGSDLIWGSFSAAALAFIRSMDLRTPGTPAFSTSRANGCWSSGRAASAAWRWTRFALRLGVLGRGFSDLLPSFERLSADRRSRRSERCVLRSLSPSGESCDRESLLDPSARRGLRFLRSRPSPSARSSRRPRLRRSESSRPSLRARPRSRSWSRSRRRDFRTSVVVTGGPSPPPINSRRSEGAARTRGADTAMISRPSSPPSASALSTEPIAAVSGTRSPLTSPLGWRAPAARHVQVPSGRWLVSSISSRRDTAHKATRLRSRSAPSGAGVGPSGAQCTPEICIM